MKELLGNPIVWQIIGGIVLLLLPSPLLKKAGDKAGDVIEGVGGVKTRDVAYEFVHDFAEGLKSESYRGNKNLISNDQIDKNLDKYKISVGLEDLESRARE